ncbi:MAG: hypothetical protein WBO46_18765 [Caldilineaceae bacterium]
MILFSASNSSRSQAAPPADLAAPTAIGDPLTGITAISSGDEHTCALTDVGLVECWGRNDSGQLGNGTTSHSALPVTVLGLTAAVSVSAGDAHTCAVTSAGGVKCWGSNFYGQLGNGTTTDSPTPVDVSGLDSGVVAVIAGGSHSCALTSSGGVKCWGSNDFAQLGDGTGTNRSTPVDVSGLSSGVAAISGSNDHTCALLTNSGIKCWGSNTRGQLGDGTQIGQSKPVDVIGLTSGVAAVSSGGYHTCALTSSGSVKCWGRNAEDQLGDGSGTDQNTPVDVVGAASGVSSVDAGGVYSCLKTDADGIACWGWNKDGQLGDGTTNDSKTPVAVDGLSSNVTAVSAGGSHTCALTNGGIKCWGANDYGQLGDGSIKSSTIPVVVVQGGDPLTKVASIDAGALHSCAVASGQVLCWGDNENGKLGDGTTITRTYAVEVASLAADVVGVSAGEDHTCGLNNAGGIKCWGRNSLGQLGNGSTSSSLTPVAVTGLASGAAEVSAGGGHTCAVVNGGVKCWGNNGSGELGDGSRQVKLTPVDVLGLTSGATGVSAGGDHTCAVVNGGVKCWGWNYYGQLGNGTTASSTIPVDVTNLASGVTAAVSGRWHTCALTAGGGVKCWGFNTYGQLGNGTKDNSATPVDVSGLNSGVVAISVGDRHSCVLMQSGGVKCWGFNSGRLGDGTNTTRTTPVDVIGLQSGVTAISVGGSHTCALLDTGDVKCWGDNANGQIGDGSTLDRGEPTPVIQQVSAEQPITLSPMLYLPSVTR